MISWRVVSVFYSYPIIFSIICGHLELLVALLPLAFVPTHHLLGPLRKAALNWSSLVYWGHWTIVSMMWLLEVYLTLLVWLLSFLLILPFGFLFLPFIVVDVELHCPVREPGATCGYWIFEMWLVQINMCCKCKIHTGFQRRYEERTLKHLTKLKREYWVMQGYMKW